MEVVREVNSTKVHNPLVLKGPFELRVDGDHQLSLALPMNISYSGSKRVLVSEGISVEVRAAQAVSLFHSSHRRYAATVDMKEDCCLWLSLGSVCVPLPPIQIIGSASLAAFRTPNIDSQIKASYPMTQSTYSQKNVTIKLTRIGKHRFPTDLLGLKIDKLEKVLSSLGNGNQQMVSSVTAELKASGMVRFQLEIERSMGRNESMISKKVEWRTKPKKERVWFEITAKIEGDKLKAVGIKKVCFSLKWIQKHGAV